MRLDELEDRNLTFSRGAVLGEIKCISQIDEPLRRRNVRLALRRKLPKLSKNLGIAKIGRPCALIGGGPSLIEHLEEVRKFPGDLIACGSVHAFLLREGIEAKYAVNVEAHPDFGRRFYTPSSKRTIYLLASNSDPDTFERLRGRKVWTWNAAGEAPQDDFLGEIAFAGGSTATLRAWPIAYQLGYKNIHFYGVDSSLPEPEAHHADPNYEKFKSDVFMVQLEGTNKVFWTSMQFAVQGRQFAEMLQYFKNVQKVTVHGDTLTRAYWEQEMSRKPVSFPIRAVA